MVGGVEIAIHHIGDQVTHQLFSPTVCGAPQGFSFLAGPRALHELQPELQEIGQGERRVKILCALALQMN